MTEGGIGMKRILCILLALIILLCVFAAPAISGMITTALHHIEYYGYTREALMPGIELPPMFSWNFSGVSHYILSFFIPSETGEGCADDITFSLRADYGTWMAEEYHLPTPEHPQGYTEYEYLGSTAIVPNGNQILWDDISFDEETGAYLEGDWFDQGNDEMFIDCIIYQDSHIIGFFVIKFTVIYHEEYGRQRAFSCTTVGSASFPKIAGEYQEIRPECIEGIIAYLRNTA